MMSGYLGLLAPEILLLIGAACALLIGVSGRRRLEPAAPWIAVAATAAALLAVWVVTASDLPSGDRLPGIHAGALAGYVRLIAASAGLLILLINMHLPDAGERGEHFAMILFSLAGVMLTAGADDLITLFLALELVSVPTYALVAAGSADVRAQEAGLKYFFLGALAAAVLAYGLSFLYGATGTTSLSSQFGVVRAGDAYVLIGLLMVLGGLAFKIAAVPLHVYAPDVYQGAASPVTGLLGFFPKAAGFVALLKILALLEPSTVTDIRDPSWVPPNVVFWVLWVLAAATMTVGNCVALLQSNVKRMLAYSSIAHSGYMLIGALVGPLMTGGPMRDGWAAVLFYLFAYGVVNLGAFGVLAFLRVQGRPAEDLDDLQGLARVHPGAALTMALCAFSLMGMPPSVGFFGKVYIFSAALGVDVHHPHQTAMVVLAVFGLLNSAVAASYYLRIIGTCYLREPREFTTLMPHRPLRLGLAICAAFVILAGVWPRDLFRLAGLATGGMQPAPRMPGPVEETRTLKLPP